MKLKAFLVEEDGMGTAEVVIIAAVLVAIALMFKEKITTFVDTILTDGFDAAEVLADPASSTTNTPATNTPATNGTTTP